MFNISFTKGNASGIDADQKIYSERLSMLLSSEIPVENRYSKFCIAFHYLVPVQKPSIFSGWLIYSNDFLGFVPFSRICGKNCFRNRFIPQKH